MAGSLVEQVAIILNNANKYSIISIILINEAKFNVLEEWAIVNLSGKPRKCLKFETLNLYIGILYLSTKLTFLVKISTKIRFPSFFKILAV